MKLPHYFLLFIALFRLTANVQAQELTDSATHLIKADSTKLVRIGGISVFGNKKTKEYIVRREFTFKEGEYILLSELEKRMTATQDFLNSSALFMESKVYIRERVDDIVFVNVEVRERWYIFPYPYIELVDRNFNEWWVQNKRSLDRITYGLKFTHYNFSGRKDKLYLYLIGGYNTQLQLRYEQPYVDKNLKHGFGIWYQYNKQKELAYKTFENKLVFHKQPQYSIESTKFSLFYYYRPAIKSSHTFRFSYTAENFADSIVILNPDYTNQSIRKMRYPELGYTFHYNASDYIPYPTRGLLIHFNATKKGFTKDMNLLQLTTNVTYTQPIFPKTQIQFQFAGILKLPFDQPYYNMGLFGREFFLRGLEYYVIDGYAGLLSRTTARKEIFTYVFNNPVKIKTIEKVPFRFFLKVYGDLGYAFNSTAQNTATASTLNNRLLKTWGVGLDVVTIYDLVFKVEYSFNQLGNQGLFLHRH